MMRGKVIGRPEETGTPVSSDVTNQSMPPGERGRGYSIGEMHSISCMAVAV